MSFAFAIIGGGSNGTTLTVTIPVNLVGGCIAPMMCASYLIPVTPGTYPVVVTNRIARGNTTTLNFNTNYVQY